MGCGASSKPREFRIEVCGLQGSGKSTIVHQLTAWNSHPGDFDPEGRIKFPPIVQRSVGFRSLTLPDGRRLQFVDQFRGIEAPELADILVWVCAVPRKSGFQETSSTEEKNFAKNAKALESCVSMCKSEDVPLLVFVNKWDDLGCPLPPPHFYSSERMDDLDASHVDASQLDAYSNALNLNAIRDQGTRVHVQPCSAKHAKFQDLLMEGLRVILDGDACLK